MKHPIWICCAVLPIVVTTAIACGSDSSDKDNRNPSNTKQDSGTTDQDSAVDPNDDVIFDDDDKLDGGADLVDETDAHCGESSLAASQRPVNLLVVVDKSGSMVNEPQGFDTTKWAALKAGLSGALEATKDRLVVGLELYPFDENDEIPLDCDPDICCTMPASHGPAVVVPLDEGGDSVPLIVDALDNTNPGGGTPTAQALAFALDYFESAEAQALEGERYVLLATDGGPNCNADITCTPETCTANIDNNLSFDENWCSADKSGPRNCLDDDRAVARATSLADQGIKTIVVGMPGTEAYTATLDAIAVAGGAPQSGEDTKYYSVTAEGGVGGLEATLTDITTQLIRTCELKLESDPPSRRKVNVRIDGEVIAYVGDAAPAADAAADGGSEALDGWVYEDAAASPPTIILKGEPCRQMLAEGAEQVDITFGCPTITSVVR